MAGILNHTNRDYESMRRELLDRVPQLTERWTDFNPSDLGVVLLELFAGVGDMLAYYIDAQISEAFLPTARQRQAIINLCKLISYRLDAPVAASTELTFLLGDPLDFDVVIPKGVRCRAYVDQEQIPFETVEATTIFRGQTQTTVAARQGWRELVSFVGTGLPWQEYRLSARDVAQDTIAVTINGEVWTEVLHFQESGREDRHFRTETDALDTTKVVFGDGIRGAAPPAGTAIGIDYLRTLGAAGNLGRNLITQLQDTIRANGSSIGVSVVNHQPATGGANRETLESAKKQAPAELRTLWKAVTKEDFQALAEGFPGVAKAQILDVNDCGHHHYFTVNLAVAPNGGGAPSQLLMDDLAAFLESRKLITTEITLYEPFYRPVNIDAEVIPLAGQDPDLVKLRVEEALADFFRFERVGFGQDIHVSDIVALIDNLRGVSHVHLFSPSADVDIRNGQIPVLGEVQITMAGA
ncbi:putative baseplate assembly protein [Sulfidibacter corallicola]|uniref:Baseplate J/gp47 family protein n=1 Tax=Sulfidibacter corallicola TaxID=2818388 RepID=A0A8A4TY91_SULCO|nr:baseplate J/gp47 family protein [Sulfidibacter corallicola]QTD54211.1 baseplate J/gp47 family protein [Sulfidibacter corallicola]